MRKNTQFFIITCLFSIGCWARGGGGSVSSSSGGGVKLGLSYMMYNTKENAQPSASGAISGTDNETKWNFMDLKFGLMRNEIFYGVVYSTAGHDTLSLSSKRTLLGAAIGYHSSGFFIDGTYYFSGKRTDEFASGDSFDGASGIGADFGYETMMGSNFYLGVQISYRDLTFSKYTPSGGTEVSTTWKQNELYPMLNLGFLF